MSNIFGRYYCPPFTEEEAEVKLFAPSQACKLGVWGFPEGSCFLVESYFCCVYFVSRLEEGKEPEVGERWGEERSLLGDLLMECPGPGSGRRGRAACGVGSWKPQVQSCGGLLTRTFCSCTDTLCEGGRGRA